MSKWIVAYRDNVTKEDIEKDVSILYKYTVAGHFESMSDANSYLQKNGEKHDNWKISKEA